jgi:hypothetical protein
MTPQTTAAVRFVFSGGGVSVGASLVVRLGDAVIVVVVPVREEDPEEVRTVVGIVVVVGAGVPGIGGDGIVVTGLLMLN